jgi:hypothetical protein
MVRYKQMEQENKQLNDFLMSKGVKAKVTFIKKGFHFNDDTIERNIYRLTLIKGKKKVSFRFGDSIHNTEHDLEPNVYNIMSCLTYYEPGTFRDFCGDYGYNEDSIKALSTYKEVVKQYNKLLSMFTSNELQTMTEWF